MATKTLFPEPLLSELLTSGSLLQQHHLRPAPVSPLLPLWLTALARRSAR